jgi:hypothetical protein
MWLASGETVGLHLDPMVIMIMVVSMMVVGPVMNGSPMVGGVMAMMATRAVTQGQWGHQEKK